MSEKTWKEYKAEWKAEAMKELKAALPDFMNHLVHAEISADELAEMIRQQVLYELAHGGRTLRGGAIIFGMKCMDFLQRADVAKIRWEQMIKEGIEDGHRDFMEKLGFLDKKEG